MTMKSKKQIQNQSQSGRSMVEMLGVLAVIAVVSIGGIVGYRLAMNHYQASQIAHEMNMMRTDAQIKIAQGTEKLTLGAPYDEHKINFNGYDTAFGCKYVDENDLISDETVSCQIANAYFIELPKIPDGVCQPLIRLINGMDNLIAFSVNDSEYEEGGTCQEGENDLYAVFSGETVSDLTHCERDDDCKELETTPVCDLSRHVCVECTQEKGCEGEEYCENNVCKSCDEGLIWNGTDCVECTENGDCENPKPYCNPTTNTCEPCENDSQCDTTQNEHCKTSTGECVVCDENTEVWDEVLKECRPPESCEELNCSNGKFCLSTNCSCVNNQEINCEKYQCLSTDTQFVSGTADNKTYYGSKYHMNWWSAKRFCEAAKGKVSGGKGMMASWGNPDFKCAHKFNLTPDKVEWGYCHADDSLSRQVGSEDNVSETIEELREMYQATSTWGPDLWLTETTDICGGYYVLLSNGRVHANWGSAEGCPIDQPSQIHGCLNDGGYAFCE